MFWTPLATPEELGAPNNYSCCSGCLEFWNPDSEGASTSKTSQWNPSRASPHVQIDAQETFLPKRAVFQQFFVTISSRKLERVALTVTLSFRWRWWTAEQVSWDVCPWTARHSSIWQQKVIGLAGSLMHSLQLKLGVTINSNRALWTWCMRHAAWILNRFHPHQGLTVFEVVYGKAYHGQACEFAEPVLCYAKTHLTRAIQSGSACCLLERPRGKTVSSYILALDWSSQDQ